MSETNARFLGVGLAGRHLVALTADAGAAARLDGAGAAFVAAGIERIDGSAPDDTTLEPTIAAALLAARVPRVAVLAAAAPHRDHPYNLARRVASLDHLSGGRSGVILGLRDAYAPTGEPGREGWGGAGLTEGVPLGSATTRDAALAVAKLWQSWPHDSIVADRASGVFARAERIAYADHRGVFEVKGPLTLPTTAQGSPVLAWYAASPEEAAFAEGADLVVLGGSAPEEVAATAAALDGHASRRPLLFVRLDFAGDSEVAGFVARAEAAAGLPGVDGLLVRPDGAEDSVSRVLDEVVPALTARGIVRPPGAGTLRDRLALPEPAPLLAGATPVFPAPAPLR
ncbi:alkanesulfonate monooxygenase SsuD/methylene tetrahydromethanopterin reductase-like flavin-dependent oxidoreductase (luciferase family) [Actinocorallia herbida]|uniref:Alkanesulfonate monooxygenase SsuD/methylene tetrahydromethanopterin reductase-like flavin-dependent oxidoreductase (Luciferase family) n=1 Tax=Actinocorallia herbida TaxID=58109 RepID=A0A3N1CSD6_9ACTN|nr:LLM class flavin-dependent oxidoreductase [Actinocorallia herbida]ROO84232.1 alkanesulfonate monooxygenase SsuD/methylene tetrahydromethanopterin reductase-like flavin-dependent oxidoreductase (luciferase family) [Actinocorallia herbida]